MRGSPEFERHRPSCLVGTLGYLGWQNGAKKGQTAIKQNDQTLNAVLGGLWAPLWHHLDAKMEPSWHPIRCQNGAQVLKTHSAF